jgi:phosphatidylserine synthase
MRRIRAVTVFPTLFTLGNLVCGFFAIVVAARIAKPGDGMAFVP